MKITVEPNEMTLGEIEFFEKESGLSFDELAAGKLNTRAVMALIVLSERKVNPRYSMDDARKLKLKDVDIVTEEDAEADDADPLDGELEEPSSGE